jgi:site-specific recombinase XerC
MHTSASDSNTHELSLVTPTSLHDSNLSEYGAWLSKQTFSKQTRRAYKSRAKLLITFMQERDLTAYYFQNQIARKEVIDRFKCYLANDLLLVPRSVNAILTAVDNHSQFLGLEPTPTLRERECSRGKVEILTLEEQRSLLDAVSKQKSERDTAIVLLIFHTGIRISECAALNLNDLSNCKSEITIHQPRCRWNEDRRLTVPDNAREAIIAWLAARGPAPEPALFTNQSGKRMTTSNIDLVIRTIGWQAHLELSARKLRNTCLANVASRVNLMEVARIAGFTNLSQARRFGPNFAPP